AEDGIRDKLVTGVQTCALPILRGGQLFHRSDERLRDEPSAIRTVIAARIRIARAEHRSELSHDSRSAANSARSFAGSFLPGETSMPDDASTPYGWTAAIASTTLPACRPPDRITGRCRATADATDQSTARPVPPRRTGSYASSNTIAFDGTAPAAPPSCALRSGSALMTRVGSVAYSSAVSSPCNCTTPRRAKCAIASTV